MSNFELFFGCLGNGITVCNKAVMENGDYKKVAHISEAGNICWYLEPEKIPGDALLRIEHQAHVTEAKFMEWFDTLSEMEQYIYLLDRAPLSLMLDIIGAGKYTLEEKLATLKKAVLPKL